MCSISINATVDGQLDQLENLGDKDMIEKRLYNFAQESDTQTPSILDAPKHHMRRMPTDLKNIRKIQIGRHRIYYTGHHTQCSYFAFYVKLFKQSGKNDEDGRQFQKMLTSATLEPSTRTIKMCED